MRISDWSSDVCSSDLLVAWPLPHIADVDLHRHLAARADARRRQAGRPKLETGVAEAEAAGEKRRNIFEHIAAPGRRLAVVEDRYLPRIARHGDGQLRAGIDVPEKDVGHGSAALLDRKSTRLNSSHQCAPR